MLTVRQIILIQFMRFKSDTIYVVENKCRCLIGPCSFPDIRGKQPFSLKNVTRDLSLDHNNSSTGETRGGPTFTPSKTVLIRYQPELDIVW